MVIFSGVSALAGRGGEGSGVCWSFGCEDGGPLELLWLGSVSGAGLLDRWWKIRCGRAVSSAFSDGSGGGSVKADGRSSIHVPAFDGGRLQMFEGVEVILPGLGSGCLLLLCWQRCWWGATASLAVVQLFSCCAGASDSAVCVWACVWMCSCLFFPLNICRFSFAKKKKKDYMNPTVATGSRS